MLDLDDSNQDGTIENNPARYFEFLKDRIIDIDGPELINEGVMTSYKLYRIKSKKVGSSQKSEQK